MGEVTQRSLNEMIVPEDREVSKEQEESWNEYEIWKSKLKFQQIKTEREREDREGTWEEEEEETESEGTKGSGRNCVDGGARRTWWRV